MLLKELINKSYYGTIGYIAKEEDLEVLEQYILYNLPVLQEHIGIIVATNYGEDLQQANADLWKKYFPEVVILDLKVNRGPNFGYCDLDDMLFDYCKDNNIEWLCKSANDIIIQESILDKKIKEADFYYTTSVGYSALFEPYTITVNKVYNTAEYFYPQTNYYFINVSKVDYLNDKQHVDEIYNKVQEIEGYDGRAWEYGFKSCEVLLKESVERNKLSYFNLIVPEKFTILLNTIKQYQIHDPSHKNIMLDGICHYPYINEQVIEI